MGIIRMSKSGIVLAVVLICIGMTIAPSAGQRIGPGMMYGYGPGDGSNATGFQAGYGPGYGMGPWMMYGYGPGYGFNTTGFQTGYGPGYGMGPWMMYGYGPSYPTSIADELSKLDALRKEGAITQDESQQTEKSFDWLILESLSMDNLAGYSLR
jgi:hypothetical protein